MKALYSVDEAEHNVILDYVEKSMNRINPEKLLLSKWTARQPANREKHFIVTRCRRDAENIVVTVDLEAVLTKRNATVAWQSLQDSELWQAGWH